MDVMVKEGIAGREQNLRSSRSSAVPFWLVAALNAVAIASAGTPAPLYVLYQARWHFSSGVLTGIYAIYAAGVLAALLLVSGSSDRIGRRPVLLGGLVLLVGTIIGTSGSALSELQPNHDNKIAALANGISQPGGLAIGALVAGALAEWVVLPLRIPYVVVLVLAVLMFGLLLTKLPETAPHRVNGISHLFRAQALHVPSHLRATFVVAGLVAGSAFAVAGVAQGLGGSLAQDLLHQRNEVIAGVVVFLVQGVGACTQVVSRSLSTKIKSTAGCACLIIGLVVMCLGLRISVAVVFLVGVAICGIGAGLAFLSATSRVTQAATPSERTEVLAAYFVIVYFALSVPTIAAGILAGHLGLTDTFYIFAAVVAVVALIGLIASAVFRPIDVTANHVSR